LERVWLRAGGIAPSALIPDGLPPIFRLTVKNLLASFLSIALTISVQCQTIPVLPYLQPGNGTTLQGADVKIVAWLTDATPGDFSVEYGATVQYGKSAAANSVELILGPDARFLNYTAILPELAFNSEIFYRVSLGGKTVRASSFLTRKTTDQAARFIVVGDTGDGKPDQRAIAWQMSRVAPDFLLIVGDIVYTQGRFSEYAKNFWPVYNGQDAADAKTGAPMMQSIPFYGILGNHDVLAADLTKVPDGFAAFYFFHPPLNGPKSNPWNTPIGGEPGKVAAFKAAAGPSYPGLCNYSFDDGPGHFLCLDANHYVGVTDQQYQKWIREDLVGSKARWKMVFFHQPGFNSSAKHNTEQRMRLLAPVFEESGVDIVFAGHVHNYQRSKPLKFAPDDPTRLNPKGLVPGKFTLDENFDGVKNTVPAGILYFVSGGGGAALYDQDFSNHPEKWLNDEGRTVPFTAKFISDRHSFSSVSLSPEKLVITQIDDSGKELDRVTVTKP
jgi:predicted phosphodiesterase